MTEPPSTHHTSLVIVGSTSGVSRVVERFDEGPRFCCVFLLKREGFVPTVTKLRTFESLEWSVFSPYRVLVRRVAYLAAGAILTTHIEKVLLNDKYIARRCN